MNLVAKEELKQEIKGSQNLTEILAALVKYYDTDTCKPGDITKSMIIAKLDTLIRTTGAKARKKYL